MCLAIAPDQRPEPGPADRIWMRVAGNPARLLATAAGLQSALLSILWFAGLLPETARATGTLFFILLHGVAGSLLLGWLLTWLPRRYHKETVHYAAYVTINFLMLAAMVLLVAGMYGADGWLVGGGVTMLSAWLVAMRSFHWLAVWIWGRTAMITRLCMSGFIVTMSGIVVFAANALCGDVQLMPWVMFTELTLVGSVCVAALFAGLRVSVRGA